MRSQTTKRFVFAIFVLGATVGSALSSCLDDQVTVKGDFGTIRFAVETADDFEERAQGLMHRQTLPKLSGMLFVYDRPGNLTFWMRNTLIPLDMIFVRPDGVIAHIHENARPLDETPISGGEGNLVVLEINGGLASKFGIKAGDVLRHPAFAASDPAWPCD